MDVTINVARSPEEAEKQARGEAVAAERDEAPELGPLFGQEDTPA
jgi:large subunit ribosomal protein L9